jgi:uncharacterized protein (TIGR02466 family)
MNDIKILKVEAIFPKPVAFYELDRDFTKEELDFFDVLSKDLIKNEGNHNTKNNYILESDELKNIKDSILFCLKNYLYNIVGGDPEKVQPYITQSWLNFTEPGEYHQKHYHPNSFISGTLYVQTNPGDNVTFFKDEKKIIEVAGIKTFNKFNCDAHFLSVKNMSILLFPGSIDHMVEIKETNDTRISLAFNSFITGTLGLNPGLTELKI